MAEIENGYYYIKDGVVLKEDGYTDSVDKVGKVVGFDYETEIRTKAIEEFAEKAMHEFTEFDLKHGYPTVADCKIILRDLAESMKGEKDN